MKQRDLIKNWKLVDLFLTIMEVTMIFIGAVKMNLNQWKDTKEYLRD